jgi:hypothetical protein
MPTLLRALAACALLLILSACGGGGGGGGGSGNSITLDHASALLTQNTNGADVTSVVVRADFHGAGIAVGTLPGQTLPSWLSVVNGTALSSTSAEFTVAATPYGLSAGRYTTTLRVATANADLTGVEYRDLPVTLVVMPAVGHSSFSLSATTGGTSEQASLWVLGAGGPWTVRSTAGWLSADKSSVSGETAVGITANPAGLATGDYSGSIVIEEPQTHVTLTVPVQLGVDDKRLVVRERGVALSLVGTQSRLTRTIAITDNGHGGTAWSAASDQPWLQLGAASGSTNGSLALSADASGLADGLHYARVTITPSGGSSAANAVVVRVGVYVARGTTFSASASFRQRDPSPRPTVAYETAFVADPIRPYFYDTEGDGQIDIHNAYTGATQGSITIPGAVLGAVAITPDGSTMYVADLLNGKIYPVNLDTLAVGTGWTPTRMSQGTFEMAYTEVNGLPVLVTSEYEVLDAQTGQSLAALAPTPIDPIVSAMPAVQRDGRAAFFQTRTLGNHELARFDLSYRNGSLKFSQSTRINEHGDGYGIALSTDDRTLYTAVGYGYLDNGGSTPLFTHDPGSMAETGHVTGTAAQGRGLASSPDGRIYIGLDYNRLGTLGADLSLQGDIDSGMSYVIPVLSGDAHRIGIRGGTSAGTTLTRFIDMP